jgi:hypothetical protein
MNNFLYKLIFSCFCAFFFKLTSGLSEFFHLASIFAQFLSGISFIVFSARPAMANLKLTNAALLQTLKNAILEKNRLEFQKKSKFWPSKWRFFKNVALEPIWVGHG